MQAQLQNREDVLEIIRRAEEEQSVELDLSDLGITELPREIGRLTSLQVLILRGLKSLPQEIGHLRNLTRLYLSYNQLAEFPKEITRLRNLTRLYLNSNELREIPPEIGLLKNLNRLYLSYNQLSRLPKEIAHLKNLNRLYLSYNQLTEIPKEIAQLRNLNILDLSSNELNALPGEIAQLRNLTRLYLGSNQLIQMPGEIGQLENLTELNLSSNQLSELPEEIAGLEKLALLYLDSNQLKAVSKKLAELENLTELNLSSNQLSELPKEIALSERLIHLDLNGNPLKVPPPEIAEQGLPAIRDYFQESGKGGQTLYEAKVMVVGQGGVGKTCLINRLTQGEYSESQHTTRGIDIRPWVVRTADDSLKHTDMVLNVWDFGGQEIYHATHQFFLTPRSLYILVWDACQEEENSRIDYWLNAIETFAEDSPILIVMNKSDERTNDLNIKELKQRYSQIVGSSKVSARTGAGIDTLRNLIRKHAWELPLMRTFWPTSWLAIRRALKATSRYYIPHRKYLEVCQKVGIEESEARTLSRYLHELGIILHFQNDILLKNTIILKPEWGTDAVYKVLDAKVVRERNGLLYNRDLPKIWTDQALYPRDKYATILRLMANFELVFPFGGGGCHIVVEFLSAKEVEYVWNPIDPLQFEYHYEFLPAGIITRLIVRMHEYLMERNDEKLCWREGAYFGDRGTRARVRLNPYLKVIGIQIDGPRQQEFLAIIRSHFTAIHKSIKKIRFNEKIPCICKPGCAHRFDYKFLLKCEEKGINEALCEKRAEFIHVGRVLDRIEKPEFRQEKLQRAVNFPKEDTEDYERFRMGDDTGVQPSKKKGRKGIITFMLMLAALTLISGSVFLWKGGNSSDIEKFLKDRFPKISAAVSQLADKFSE
jgi:small GTP-binding protein